MDSRVVEIRNAADSLLVGSVQHQSYHPQSYHTHGPHCSPCQHIIMSEDIMAGLQTNGSLSVVRRFFCLFVTFDLLFTSMMWLICLVLVGNFDFYQVFTTQILHYHIQTSLFDIVMAAMVRFTALLLFYALLHINHWCIVALTTAGTCSFLVVKVYIFNWSVSNQPVLQVLLILSSFILSWSEAWFLDLRVIPQERHARDYINASGNNERSPLLQSFLQRNSRFDTMSESVGTFYSPVESPEGSDDEGERDCRRTRQAIPIEMATQYRVKGEETVEAAWTLLTNGKWSLEKQTNQGDKIYKQKLAKGHTIYRITATLDITTSALFNVLFKNIEDIPKWNPTLKESRVIQEIDDRTDISYQLTGESGGGIVTGRDFVLLRHWQNKHGRIIIANISVNCPCPPSVKKYIRAENGAGCWSIKDLGGRSEVEWLLNTNIKGWLPQYVVNASLTGVIADSMAHLRKHISQLQHITAS